MAKIKLTGDVNLSVDNAFEQFIRYKTNRNKADNTIKSYENSFRKFKTFYDVDLPCKTITEDVIENYIEYLLTVIFLILQSTDV